MTTKCLRVMDEKNNCSAENVLKAISGKWKPQIFRIALNGPIRFNTLLRQLANSNKQSISTALRELNEEGILDRIVVKEKPLHVEYSLSKKGKEFVHVFQQLELLS